MYKTSHYAIMKNTDGVEGRGQNVPTGIAFSDKEMALDFAMSDEYKPFAVMNVVSKKRSDAEYHIKHLVTIVYDDMDDYKENSGQVVLEKLKSKALSKLTPKEIEALKTLGI